MKRKFYSVLTLLTLSAGVLSAQHDTTLNFTGSLQTFTVPCGVDSVFIETWGAQGGAGNQGNSSSGPTNGGSGGFGGYAGGWLMVTPGQTLNIMVGGQGSTPTAGFNGGGTSGADNAGGGGGASDVRVNGTAESDRVITAGGGGGGGRGGCEGSAGPAGAGGNGGAGGGGNGQDGVLSQTSGGDAGGGFGGVGVNGGGAGIGCGGFLGVAGNSGSNGTGGNGGAGQACCCFSFPSVPGGGGGGGGQLGGGGGGGGSAGTTGCSGNDKGAGGGGAGGTNYTAGVLNGIDSLGVHSGDGMIMITWNDPIPAPAVITGTTAFCAGDSVTLSISADPLATFYTWAVDTALDFVSGQNTTSIVLAAGTTPGTYMVTAWAVNGTCSFSGTPDTVMITVNALPTVTYTSPMPVVCLDDDNVALTGSPAGGTFSGTAVTGNSFSPSTAGVGNYLITYMYTDTLGCSNWASDSIMVDPCLGIAQVVTNGISVSPNPASDVLNVSWNSTTQVSSIKIMDVTGRVVMTENVANGNTKQLNISSLPAGTYSVALEGASEKSSYTFVKK